MHLGKAMKKQSVALSLVGMLIMISIQQLVAAGVPSAPGKIARQVPAVYVLGDSTLDVGNNNYLPGKDVPRANKPYYGIDFPVISKPTGRFSNGYNVADFIAKNLGFDKSPPAYLMLKAHNRLIPTALTMGVSYASAGAGILDSTNAGGNIPLSKQVRDFKSTRGEMVSKVGSGAVRRLLAKSFFLFGVGSNDMFVFSAAQQKQNRTATPADRKLFYSNLISNYSAAITELYKMGARKFAIINLGPVGCVPIVRLASATGACDDRMNQLAVGFDGELKSLMAGLAARLPGLAYSLADSFASTQLTFANPAAAGFANADSACCGSGRLGSEGECRRGASLCGDRDRYVFWDRVHPSQQACKLGAQAYFYGPAHLISPINFSQLAAYSS
ncbi:hypothetical protein GUJ93_ZPchr0012g21476 [Zizania palustris]|uniref:GDSL esterase/lipase n=1 Tax=Zizania palustris TaxID=103762 RepID=A0A8J6BS55_ZIZPA|nr:hypothetical protein GUJ93_ZPchr0012g21476 [Zizania palustris]